VTVRGEVEKVDAKETAEYWASRPEQLLAATLEVDDHIEFESLKKFAQHPPFSPGPLGLGRPLPHPQPESLPVEPVFGHFAPVPPTGIGKLFGGKTKYDRALAVAQQQFAQAHGQWQQDVAAVEQRIAHAERQHQRAEQERLTKLAAAKEQYQQQCAQRQPEVDEHNADVDAVAAAFAAGDPQAILEYFTLVLANFDYPASFPQRYRVACVPESKQLVIEYELPTIDCVPTERECRYVKAKDEISFVARPTKDIRSWPR
jgi:restriction system protein